MHHLSGDHEANRDTKGRNSRVNTFQGKVAVITGGAQGIGRAIADAFIREGATVHVIDIKPGDWFVGDVSNQRDLERFALSVISHSGLVYYLFNNALPLM